MAFRSCGGSFCSHINDQVWGIRMIISQRFTKLILIPLYTAWPVIPVAALDMADCSSGSYACVDGETIFHNSYEGALVAYSEPDAACAGRARPPVYTNPKAELDPDYGMGCSYDVSKPAGSPPVRTFYQNWIYEKQVCTDDRQRLGAISLEDNLFGLEIDRLVCFHCPEGTDWRGRYSNTGKPLCEENLYCPENFVLDLATSTCRAYCPMGSNWNGFLQNCEIPPADSSCETQSEHPIDFIRGRKYRVEPVVKIESKYPIELVYFYNSHGNNELTTSGILAPRTAPRFVGASRSPIPFSDYTNLYNDNGVLKSSEVAPDQYYASNTQYWRHNFDDILQFRDNFFLYHPAKGERIIFTEKGFSASHPELHLQRISPDDETFTGYKLANIKTSVVKKFDENGRLMKVEEGTENVLALFYDSAGRLEKVVNRLGEFLQLSYESQPTNSVYSVSPVEHFYPVRVAGSGASGAILAWGHSISGQSAKFFMLTQIEEVADGNVIRSRRFAYGNSRWPAALTDVFNIIDMGTGEEALHANFEYDDKGRAVYSGLASGADAVRLEYLDDYSRIVTNAFGKKAVYEFADINGARRLRQVYGEPTENCLQSQVEYSYDSAGNIEQKIENRIVTSYQYDSLNREISRTEAAGTPEARTITTDYHPTLNKPIRIAEPGKVTAMQYDSAGRLLSTSIEPSSH